MKLTVRLLVFSILILPVVSAQALDYHEEDRGSYLYTNPFAHKPETPAEHFDYAGALKTKGKLDTARRQYAILAQRWPDSPEAPRAKQAEADIYFEQGRYREAFDTYRALVRDYFVGITDYNAVLDRLFDLAVREMERRRLPAVFGGYDAPERAVPLFEQIISSAPQWERAPEAQYLIGRAYQRSGKEEEAIAAYSTVEYRYPQSPFAAQAAWRKLECYRKLVNAVRYSIDLQEQARAAIELFLITYPDSEHTGDALSFQAELDEKAAQFEYETGEFYESISRPAHPDAAQLYYERAGEYEGTEWASKAVVQMNSMTSAVILAGKKASSPGFGIAPVDAPPPVEPTLGLEEEAVEVKADKLEYIDRLLVGEGNVTFYQQGVSIRADHVAVNPDTGDVLALGNISARRGADVWTGEELDYNFKTKKGSFGSATLFFDPVYITADEIERISTNEYVLHNATITTCSPERPAISVRAREVRLVDETFVKAKGATLLISDVPVFYMPYYQRHFDRDRFITVFGYGGRVGGFLLTRTTFRPTDWLTTVTHVDYRTRRGIGLGQDFKWETPGGSGAIRTYWLRDRNPYDDDDGAPGDPHYDLIDNNRWRVKITHHEEIRTNAQTYFDTEFNIVSDPDIIEDFFNEEFRNEANPENYAVLQHNAGRYSANLRIDRSPNEFYDTIERVPRLGFDWYRGQIGETPLYFENMSDIGFYEHLFSSTNALPPHYRSWRYNTRNTVYWPLRFFNSLNVIPRATYQLTGYSDTTNGSAQIRHIFEGGALTSFKAYKPLSDQSAFWGEGLRHVAEPYADYTYRYDPSVSTSELHQFDWIDALDEENSLRFGMRNLLQTRRGPNRTVNFVDSDIYTVYHFNRGRAQFDALMGELDISFTDNIRLQFDAEYDIHRKEVDVFNTRLEVETSDSSRLTAEYRYRSTSKRSLIGAELDLFPNQKWGLNTRIRYDTRFSELEEARILVRHQFDCIGTGLGFRIDEDEEVQFWLQLWLSAFPTTSLDIGQ